MNKGIIIAIVVTLFIGLISIILLNINQNEEKRTINKNIEECNNGEISECYVNGCLGNKECIEGVWSVCYIERECNPGDERGCYINSCETGIQKCNECYKWEKCKDIKKEEN